MRLSQIVSSTKKIEFVTLIITLNKAPFHIKKSILLQISHYSTYFCAALSDYIVKKKIKIM